MNGRVVSILSAFFPLKEKRANNHAPGSPINSVSRVDKEACAVVNQSVLSAI